MSVVSGSSKVKESRFSLPNRKVSNQRNDSFERGGSLSMGRLHTNPKMTPINNVKSGGRSGILTTFFNPEHSDALKKQVAHIIGP